MKLAIIACLPILIHATVHFRPVNEDNPDAFSCLTCNGGHHDGWLFQNNCNWNGCACRCDSMDLRWDANLEAMICADSEAVGSSAAKGGVTLNSPSSPPSDYGGTVVQGQNCGNTPGGNGTQCGDNLWCFCQNPWYCACSPTPRTETCSVTTPVPTPAPTPVSASHCLYSWVNRTPPVVPFPQWPQCCDQQVVSGRWGISLWNGEKVANSCNAWGSPWTYMLADNGEWVDSYELNGHNHSLSSLRAFYPNGNTLVLGGFQPQSYALNRQGSPLQGRTFLMQLDCINGPSCVTFCFGGCNNVQVRVVVAITAGSNVQSVLQFEDLKEKWLAAFQSTVNTQMGPGYVVRIVKVSSQRRGLPAVEVSIGSGSSAIGQQVLGTMRSSAFTEAFETEFKSAGGPLDYASTVSSSSVQVVAPVGTSAAAGGGGGSTNLPPSDGLGGGYVFLIVLVVLVVVALAGFAMLMTLNKELKARFDNAVGNTPAETTGQPLTTEDPYHLMTTDGDTCAT